MRLIFKLTALLAALATCFTFSSCEPEPGSGPNAEGIHGGVKIYTQHGEEQELSNVTVTIEQTGKTTKTDSDGAYWLPHLPSGTYTLKFTKDGHPTDFVKVEHARTRHTSTLAPMANMIEPSSFQVTPVTVTVNTDDPISPYFRITAKLSKPIPAGKKIKVKMYLGKDASVSAGNYVHHIAFETTSQDLEIIYPYFASLRVENEMKKGDRVYMVLYTDSVVEATCTGNWNKPDCSNSSTLNTRNATVFSELMP